MKLRVRISEYHNKIDAIRLQMYKAIRLIFKEFIFNHIMES